MYSVECVNLNIGRARALLRVRDCLTQGLGSLRTGVISRCRLCSTTAGFRPGPILRVYTTPLGDHPACLLHGSARRRMSLTRESHDVPASWDLAGTKTPLLPYGYVCGCIRLTKRRPHDLPLSPMLLDAARPLSRDLKSFRTEHDVAITHHLFSRILLTAESSGQPLCRVPILRQQML